MNGWFIIRQITFGVLFIIFGWNVINSPDRMLLILGVAFFFDKTMPTGKEK